ncbi:hypothetical protein ASF45_12510 [Pseudorhodoferax sp. Leaf265]|nr:hypothetical protein ASF45_12510 [Pseudorhodoferax sp. Leaf265]
MGVIEVISRAEQGRTQPYLCRCDDGHSYYVKGRSANRRGLAAEVICAQLATALDLPVPEAVIAEVPDELIEASKAAGISLDELGPGPCFGSQVVQAVEFTMSHKSEVTPLLKQSLAVFDWWTRNEDRTLTAFGGNVNLLWRLDADGGLVVIDHNLAFSEFSPQRFLDTHVFADTLVQVAEDMHAQTDWSLRLGGVLAGWDSMCSSIPSEWNYIDVEQTVPSDINLEATKALLDRCEFDGFWNLK